MHGDDEKITLHPKRSRVEPTNNQCPSCGRHYFAVHICPNEPRDPDHIDPRDEQITNLARDLAEARQVAEWTAANQTAWVAAEERADKAEADLAALRIAASEWGAKALTDGLTAAVLRADEAERRLVVLRKGVEDEAWRLQHLIDNITGPAAAKRLRSLLTDDATPAPSSGEPR